MKPLACWRGKHSWTTQIEHGEQFTVCSACGKQRIGHVQDDKRGEARGQGIIPP